MNPAEDVASDPWQRALVSNMPHRVGTIATVISVVVGMSCFAPVVHAASVSTSTSAQVAALLSQLDQLQAQIAQFEVATATTVSTDCPSLTRDLTLGATGADVQRLQSFLNSHGSMLATSGAGSPGNETDYFGALTKQALARFQAVHDISPAAGYLGSITRAAIASSCPGQASATTSTATDVATSTVSLATSTSTPWWYPNPVTTGYAPGFGGAGGSTTQTSDTPAADTTPPVVSITAPANNSTVSGTSVPLTASASDNVAVANVQFKLDGADIGSAATSSPYTTTWDSTGVADGSHTLSAVAQDAAGNYATSSVTITVDNIPPVISGISTDITGTTTATISWTSDKPSNSQIAYGTTTSYGSTTTLDASLVTSHSVSLSGLLPDYPYHFVVLSSDTAGNLATSSDQTLSTLSAYGSGTFFADTFDRGNTTPSASPGSVGNGWIDSAGNTYSINNDELTSSNYAWEDTLYRYFPGQNWSTGNFYGYADLSDNAASSTTFLLGYSTTTNAVWRALTFWISPNGGWRYAGVGDEYSTSNFYGSSNAYTYYSTETDYRFTFSFNGTTWTASMLDMSDPTNPITLATESETGPPSGQYNWNVLGIAGAGFPIQQLVLSNVIPTWNSQTIAYNNAAFYYSPNNWYDTGSSYRTVDAGSYVKFKFTGTRISVDVADAHTENDIIGWQIDGGPYQTHELPYQMDSMSLAQGLSDTTHTITIWFDKPNEYSYDRWTDANTESFEITGFQIDSGATVSLPSIQPKTALFFGDSITETAVPENSWQSWAPQLANDMGWEYGQVGFSYQGWTWMLASTNVGDFAASWPYYYGTHSRLSSGEFVDQPNYIFLNYGQNDQTYNDVPSTVQSAVESALPAMRTAAPSATIFLVIPFTGAMRTPITAAFDAYEASTTDSNAYLIDLGLNGPPDYDSEDGLHPTAAGAAYIAGLMQTAVDSDLGL